MDRGSSISPELIGALRRHPIWAAATDVGVRRVLRSSVDVSLREGERLVVLGETALAVYVLVSGVVRAYFPARRGNPESTIRLFDAPAVFGDAEALGQLTWAKEVVAVTAVRVLRIEAQTYFDVLKTEPVVCFNQYSDLARRFRVSRDPADLDARVATLLLAYAKHFGLAADGSNAVLIDRELSQDQLASEAGASRRSLVRVLGRLHSLGLVRKQGRRLVIVDMARLRSALDSRPSGTMSR